MKTLITLFALLFFFQLHAQRTKKNNAAFYVFDQNGKGCKPENATYLGVLQKLSDTAYEWKYYHYDGPLISVETYRDKEVTLPHGEFFYYGADGRMDSSGHVFEGKKNSWWYFYTDSFTVWKKEEYEMGKLIRRMDPDAVAAEREELRKKSGAEQHWGEIEAEFKGGVEDWISYIQKNINYPERANSLKKEGSLMLQFIVNIDGTTSDFRILKSVEYSLDEEAIRLIAASPKWRPAHQDGKLVKAFRRQPLTFQMPK